MSGRLETMLARVLRRGAGPPPAGRQAAHQAALEQELLARYGELHPKSRKERTMGATMPWRAAMVAGLLVAAGGATQAPAEYQAEIGKRITVRSDAPLPREQVQAIVEAVQVEGPVRQVRVRGVREGSGPLLTTIEILGETIPLADVPAAVRRAVPLLAALPVEVVPVERTVQGDLGDKLRHLAGRDHLPAEVLEQLIEAELRATDPAASVRVEVTDGEGTRDVRVEVKKEKVLEGEATPR